MRLFPLAQSSSQTLMSRLDPYQRLQVLAGLAIILTMFGVWWLFLRGASRMARWYINRPPRRTTASGDPFARVIDAKPRRAARERQNWHRP